MNAREIAARHGLKREGREWRRNCPVCGYKNGLTVSEGKEGPLLKCFGSCPTQAATWAGVMGDALPSPPERAPAAAPSQDRRAAVRAMVERARPSPIVPAYFGNRGLLLPPSAPLLYLPDAKHPSGRRLPCMVALLHNLFVSAGNPHVLASDNLSSIPEGFADAFCRIATGGAFSSRAMFTDADESILSAVKPLLLNGIPATLTGRPDMASRALSLELARLTARRAERELMADYARALPGLLGLACDGLASALRSLDRTKLAEDVRMIDAATWAEAAAEGLGIPPGRIGAAWVANRTAADRALVESDELALAVAALLAEEERETLRAEWRGTPSDLFHKLGVHATDQAKRGPQWPRSPSGMGTRLRRLAPPLRTVHGIDVQAGKGGADSARYWVLRRL